MTDGRTDGRTDKQTDRPSTVTLAAHARRGLTTLDWTETCLRYLKGTVHYGIVYSKQSSKECVGYSDAAWAGDLDDRKSTSGYLFQISGGAETWKSKKQPCVALSTAEAEYMALFCAAQEAVWLRQLTAELGSPPKTAKSISKTTNRLFV